MKIILGMGLGGPSHRTESGAGAWVGEPAWGPVEFVRDLELRLGFALPEEPLSARVPRYQAAVVRLAGEGAFYAASCARDPLGTAGALLGWRDALVEAGWDGTQVPGGGDRLDALALLEAATHDAIATGWGDRLVRAERALTERDGRGNVYEKLRLVEPRALYSERLRRIFVLLEAAGTVITEHPRDLAAASPDTDLGWLQQHLRGDGAAIAGRTAQGDGSLVVLRGDTADELAELTAALLAQQPDDALVVRSLHTGPLEAALLRHGLPTQGHRSRSDARPAMQLLPLVLELAYAPRDPYRVLELLTLPVGPFRGAVGAALARALSEQPGIGGQAWTRARDQALDSLRAREVLRAAEARDPDPVARAAERVDQLRERIETWLEQPGAPPAGAPVLDLVEAAGRLATWMRRRLMDETYVPAYRQVEAFTGTLSQETRTRLTQEEARRLLDGVVRAASPVELTTECAGRIAHVAHPSGVLAQARTVIFWGFVAGTERQPTRVPWQASERDALAARGVRLPDQAALLAEEMRAWRRAILSARERVVFVVPNAVLGCETASHPMWDEICARLSIDAVALDRLTQQAHATREGGGRPLVPLVALEPLALPPARSAWHLPAGVSPPEAGATASATSLEQLVSCPLAWVLERRAKVRQGAVARVTEGARLNGNLGHRLVEELHDAGAFERDEETFTREAGAVLRHLLQTEAETLLLAGQAFERTQLVRQIVLSMRELHRYLRASGFRIAGVEEELRWDSAVGRLMARLDLRLVDAEGNVAVLDLKWGDGKYRKLLEEGRALQLAVYTQGVGELHAPGGGPLPAGYFSLSRGRVLTQDLRLRGGSVLDGPALDETWRAAMRTILGVEGRLRTGGVLVGGTRAALPLLEALEVPEKERPTHFATPKDEVCTYCKYQPICGKAWEEGP